ncbi:hypothetical protein HDU91_004871, partial [Kappamyces sp. JEL0680]
PKKKEAFVPPAPKPRPTDPLLLLFDCLERSDYITFQKTFDSVVTGPEISNKLVACDLFDTPFTWSLLHAACWFGQIKAVEALIEKGANIELEDTWYRGRPFAWACFGGHPKLCRILMDKYKVDKNAKNAHGQTAWDLLPDPNLPHWKALFAEDRKPDVKRYMNPPVVKKPAIVHSASVGPLPSRRSLGANAVGMAVTPSAPAIPTSRQAQIQALQASSGASLGKTYPRRGASTNPLVQKLPPSTPQPAPAQRAPAAPTAYQSYIAQIREHHEQTALIANMRIISKEGFAMGIPIQATDVENGYSGAFVAVPKGVTGLTCRMHLNPTPFQDPIPGNTTTYTVTGHHGSVLHVRTPDGAMVAQPKSEALYLRHDGESGEIQEFSINLADAINSVELCITATSWGDGDVVQGHHQTYVLILDRT